MKRQVKADATCINCGTLHEDLPVDRDEHGGHVEIETQPCHDDNCPTKLCSSCPQFTCFCCGLTFCLQSDHVGREEEPECTCNFSGDIADTRGCDVHGKHPVKVILWCRLCAAAETVEQRYQPAVAVMVLGGLGEVA